jgi:cell division protein FtsB
MNAIVLRHTINDRRSVVRQSLVLVCCLGATVYFAYHALHGRHGLLARNRLIERESLLAFETKSLEAVRARLERDVALLAPELPNPDIVEESAREMLGFVHPGDSIVTLQR